MQVWSLGQEVPPGKGNGNPLQYLAWETPWTEEPGGCSPWGQERVRNDLATKQQPHPLIKGKMASLDLWEWPPWFKSKNILSVPCETCIFTVPMMLACGIYGTDVSRWSQPICSNNKHFTTLINLRIKSFNLRKFKYICLNNGVTMTLVEKGQKVEDKSQLCL